jgi:hypothetical protein
MATEGHARVLLYDVGHDREFIAFHDIHMQVQSSAATPTIGFTRDITYDGGTEKLDKILMQVNGGAPHYLSTQIDEGKAPYDQQQKLTLEFYEKRLNALEENLEKMRNGSH